MVASRLPTPVRVGDLFVHTIVVDNPVGTTTTMDLVAGTQREVDAMLRCAPRVFHPKARYWVDLADALEANNAKPHT